MTVTSPVWLSTMLLTVAIYWIIAQKIRQPFLVLATASFLLYADYRSFFLLAVFTVCTWSLLELKLKHGTMIALAIPGVVLSYYKIQGDSDPLATLQDLIVPLGLSYTTFRILHYVLERSRNNLPDHSFKDYIAYVFFLPTILIGPINRFPQFVSDCRTGRWRTDQISGGIERILVGYFKVTVLGNFLLSNIASEWVASAHLYSQALGYYLESVRGSLNLYVQFSGFSDIAIGFALMLGFKVMENFRFPFLQKNIVDFWRCWHISLVSWSREYIFMAILSITRNPYTATLSSLLFIGIWHEISLRYVVWGLYHGLGILACMQWGKFKKKKKFLSPGSPALVFCANFLKVFLTGNFFFLGYNIANQGSLAEAAHVIGIILMPWIY